MTRKTSDKRGARARCRIPSALRTLALFSIAALPGVALANVGFTLTRTNNLGDAFTSTADMLGGGALLQNKPYGYYMGRVWDGMMFNASDIRSHHSDVDNFFFGVPVTPNQGVSNRGGTCLWIGTSNGAPQRAPYWTSTNWSVPNYCANSTALEAQLAPQTAIGNTYNCGESQAWGPQLTTLREDAGFYYNVNWQYNSPSPGRWQAGAAYDQRGILPAGTLVGYRFTSGDKAIIFHPSLGWGFVLASKVRRVTGFFSSTWDISAVGGAARQRVCGDTR